MEGILLEFTSTVEWLKSEMDMYRASHKESKQQMFKLLEHKRKLIAELKRFAAEKAVDMPIESTVVRDLEQRLKEAIDLKASIMDMWQKTLKELEIERQNRYESTGEQMVEERITAVNSHYAKGLNILSQELSVARNELSNVKADAKKLAVELEHLKGTYSKCRDALARAESSVKDLKSEKHELVNQSMIFRTEISEKNKLIDTKIKENNELVEQISKLRSMNNELHEKLSVISHEKIACEKDAKESLLTAQEAVLQKKEISFKEQVALKFIQSLKSSIDQEIDHATLRYRNEIKNIQKEYSEEVESLTKEIRTLHTENNDKQSSLEKLQRQVHATEAKLDSMCTDSSKFISVTVFNDMCRRLTLTEKARDEAIFKVQSLDAQLKDLKQSGDHEAEFYRSESISWKERFQKLQNDFTKTTEEKMNLVDKVMHLKKKCVLLERDLQKNVDHHEKELSVLNQILHQKQSSFLEQMSVMDEKLKKLVLEHVQLLETQNKTTRKWKNIAEELTVSSEMKIKEMYDDIIHLQNQNQELLQQLGYTK